MARMDRSVTTAGELAGRVILVTAAMESRLALAIFPVASLCGPVDGPEYQQQRDTADQDGFEWTLPDVWDHIHLGSEKDDRTEDAKEQSDPDSGYAPLTSTGPVGPSRDDRHHQADDEDDDDGDLQLLHVTMIPALAVRSAGGAAWTPGGSP